MKARTSSPGTKARTGGSGRTNAMEAFMPTSPLATMVAVIKIPVITLALVVSGPIGILSPEIIPVIRIALIPGIPPRSVPVIGSDNIGRRIGVIRAPAILIAEKIIQYAI
jgi:hypothetical protein